MSGALWSQPWFVWALALGVGFPILVIVLGEVVSRLRQAGNALEGPLAAVRSWLLPLLVFRLLLTEVLGIDPTTNGVRVVTTLALIGAIGVVLTVVNVVAFGAAEAGSWRAKVPRLLRDLVVLGLILMGVALVLSAVWGFELANLITALGLGSIVIGLALQDTLGSIMSGIALISERPFSEGDWIEVEGVEGRVMEINWRAVRLLTRQGDWVVVPHLIVARQVLRNHSQPTGAHAYTVTIGFGYQHPPNEVKAVLAGAAREASGVLADPSPVVRTINYGDSAVEYEVMYWTDTAETAPATREGVLTRIWYAAQRHGLEIPYPIQTQFNVVPEAPAVPRAVGEAIEPLFGRSLGGDGALEALEQEASLLRFGAGERIVTQGQTDARLYVIIAGEARVSTADASGAVHEIESLRSGGMFGLLTLFSGKPSPVSVTAVTDLDVVTVRADSVSGMLEGKPHLVREIGQIIEARRKAMEAVGARGAR